MDNIYETLLSLPLFQGVSRNNLLELTEKTPFHFLKFKNGSTIFQAGDQCTHIRFLISGEITLTMQCENKRVQFVQTLVAPNVIGPDYLFGRNAMYPFSATAKGQCGVLQILKADYMNMLQSDRIFLFNILNVLSRNAQKPISNMLSSKHGTIAERLSMLVSSVMHDGAKEFKIVYRQKDLCTLLGSQRTSFVNALEQLKEEGAIDYTNTEITVLDPHKMA